MQQLVCNEHPERATANSRFDVVYQIMCEEHNDRYLPAIPKPHQEISQQCVDAAMNGKIEQAFGTFCIFSLTDFVRLKKEVANNMGGNQFDENQNVQCLQ